MDRGLCADPVPGEKGEGMIRWCTDRNRAREIFGDWQETMIWSCLEGIMGSVYVNENGDGIPTAALAVLGDFSFAAGMPDEELAAFCPNERSPEFHIMVPQNEAWEDVIERCYGKQARKVTRYAIKKEPNVFERERLLKAAGSPGKEYEIRAVDEELYRQCRKESWSRDLVSQFESYEKYRSLGMGSVILCGGKIVSGASSYTRYKGGIEVEIDTKKEFRRRGLAFACGAALILQCLDRGLYPSWDAQNLWSVALAEKLGYHFSHEYAAYEIRQQDNMRRNL